MSEQLHHNNNGLKNIISSYDVTKTADRLEKILNDNGMSLVARIDHAAGAKKIGKQLRPTLLILFANPKAGTPLIQNSQSIAIDLPQKILVWQDSDGKVWSSFNDPNYLAQRHGITGHEELIAKIGHSLDSIIKEASQ